jgi:putative ABC transport system ATP-binding protein
MLTMTNLSKVYRTEFLETFALRDFSIDVKEGEFVAITGPSGSGKTTFLNVAGILEEFTTGKYLLDGVNVQNMSDDQRSRLRNEKIGFIFQAFNLILDLSVFANVELPLHYRRITAAQRKSQVTDALRRVGLSARSKHHPGELSGGHSNASRLPALSPAAHAFCSLTSPRVTLILRRHAGSWDSLKICTDREPPLF